MITLADVIFPAFTTPYVSVLFFPVAVAAALVAEAGVFRLLNWHLPWRRIAKMVVVINMVSASVGFLIAAFLPSGLELNGEHVGQPGAEFGTYAALGYVLAFFLSILIEWGMLRALSRVGEIGRPFLTVALANTASYAVLIVVSVVWRRFLW